MSIWVVVDHVGRQFLGNVTDENGDILTIESPLLISEIIQPTQDSNQAKVDLRVQPICHTYDVPSIEVRWASRYPANEQLSVLHEKFVAQTRAKRAGIEIASSMPKGLSLVRH